MQNEQGKMRNEIKLKKKASPRAGERLEGSGGGLYWIRTSDPPDTACRDALNQPWTDHRKPFQQE